MFDHLPQEIVEEILHRLPVKSLVKFTSVCKAWNSLIKSQTFITDHLNRSIEASNGTLFFQFYETKGRWNPKHFYSLYQVNHQQIDNPFPVERFPLSHLFEWDYETLFAGTCNGLVCCAKHRFAGLGFDSHPPTLVIWNPLLRKYLLVPQPNVNFKKRKKNEHDLYTTTCFGFGFDSRNSDYKVIRVTSSLPKQHTFVDVYSLASRSWTNITVGIVPRFYFIGPYYSLPPMFLNGAVHWVVDHEPAGAPRPTRFILSFDVIKETFGELELPQRLRKRILISLLSVEGGNSLAVVNKRPRRRHDGFVYSIWVMKEYGITESWTRVFCCTSDRYGGIASVLALTITGKVILSIIGGDIILVDPITQSMETIGHQNICRKAFGGSYVESLFLIKKQPDVLSC